MADDIAQAFGLLPLGGTNIALGGGEAVEVIERPAPWQSRAACRGVGVDRFFVEGSAKQAKRICATCPVRQECLDYACELNLRHGIWGGIGASTREMRRARADWLRRQR